MDRFVQTIDNGLKKSQFRHLFFEPVRYYSPIFDACFITIKLL